MTEEQKLILALIFLVISIVSFICVFLYTKKVVKVEKQTVESLEKETLDFYKTLKLKDNKYFPYFQTHAAGVRRKNKYEGDRDNITNVTTGNHSKFYFDRILYIINGKLKYPYKKETIDEKEYIVFDDKIKTIELLVSFEKPSHFLIKYKVNKIEKDKYEIELIGVDDHESGKEE